MLRQTLMLTKSGWNKLLYLKPNLLIINKFINNHQPHINRNDKNEHKLFWNHKKCCG